VSWPAFVFAEIILALCCARFLLALQTSPNTSNPVERVLVRVRPAASAQENKKALMLLMRLFEPEKIPVAAGTKLTDLSLGWCGRVDESWIGEVFRNNPSLAGRNITQETTLSLPPCPFWGRGKAVRIPNGGTLSHQLLLHMGTVGNKTLARVATANERTVTSLNDVKPGDVLRLPYVTSFSAYALKQEYRGNPSRVSAVLKEIPGYTAAMPQRSLNLIVAASDNDCATPINQSEWPFSMEKLRRIIEYNSTRRRRPPRLAVIAVADTGLDKNEDRVFLKINDRENPVPNNIDDDENGYIDDIQGANIDRSVTGFPALDVGYRDSKHGTHVSGLALGGLRDDAFNTLIKDRIRIQELNLVHKEVQQIGTSPPITTYSIPNDFLLDAFQYAAQDPVAQIINLSVEAEESSGLEEALAGTSSLVVAAAGNDGVNLDEDEKYPAAAKKRDRLITVAAYDGSGGLAEFSNWGMHNVDLAAPGCQIDSILPGGSRGRLSGTSQAAPLVSFTAALLYSEGLTIPQIKTRILLTTETDHSKLGTCAGAAGRCVASEGRLDIIKALNVYQDVLVIRNPDGTQGVLYGRVRNCVRLDGRCYDVRRELKRLIHETDSEEGRVWIKSKANEVHSRPCKINEAADIEFQETGSPKSQLIPMTAVLDLVPSVLQ
jgi:subtilisin family serine protease